MSSNQRASLEGMEGEVILLLVVRYPNGTVLAERAVPPGEAITTTLREWMLSDDWTGLCEGMTISVERVNQEER